MRRLFTIVPAALLSFCLFAQEQTTPPAPAEPREARLPKPVEKTLPNGLRVIVVPRHETPLVAARLMVKAGGAADTKALPGLAYMTAAVLTKGTSSRSAEEIALGVEALGATLEAGAGWDSSTVDVSVMASNLAPAMAFVADVVRNATFTESELDRERQLALDELQVVLGQPRSLGSLVMARLTFGDAPYGHNLAGTPESLAAITNDALKKFHGTHYRPEKSVLVFAGDVKPEAAFSLAEKLFGSWKRGPRQPAEAVRAASKSPAPRIVVVDLPEAGQASVLIGRQGIRRTDSSYMPAMVANSVLGGGYSSRLNQEIRIRRGLSYGAGSSYEPRLSIGPFVARTDTKNESAAEVAELIVGEIRRLSKETVEGNELAARKAVLIGEFGQSLETTTGIVNRVSALALYALPLAEINRYVSGVQSVKAEQVRDFARLSLDTDRMNLVIVGDSKAFIEPLKKRFENVEVIPIDDLDLATPTLRTRLQKE
ncbi:MAG TPA: pitrilysin family protein [Thermoanaerobaculia bacterium]